MKTSFGLLSLSLILAVFALPAHSECTVADKAVEEGRFAAAVSYYYMCIDRGEAEAGYRLGSLYYQGKGGKKADRETARTLFKIAAERGNTSAQGLLGVMIITGDGAKEPAKAEGYKWLLLANEKPENKWFYLQTPTEEAKIKDYIARFSKHLTTEEKTESRRLAAKWKQERINQNAKAIFSAKEYESFIRRYNSAGSTRRQAIDDFTTEVNRRNKESD